MSETWAIVLRTPSGTMQWVSTDVVRVLRESKTAWTATPMECVAYAETRIGETPEAALLAVSLRMEFADPSLTLHMLATPTEREAWLEGVRETLRADAVKDAPPIRILYRNHRGDVAVRTITPTGIRFAATEWHPEPQWVLDAVDAEKGARSFAVRDVIAWTYDGTVPVDPAEERRAMADFVRDITRDQIAVTNENCARAVAEFAATKDERDALRLERDRLLEREAYFAAALKVADSGQYRADWPGAIGRLIAERDALCAVLRALRPCRECRGLATVRGDDGKVYCDACSADFPNNRTDLDHAAAIRALATVPR